MCSFTQERVREGHRHQYAGSGRSIDWLLSVLGRFIRRSLKQGARRIGPDPTALVSPVDGRVGAAGTVENGTMFQVKGRSYKLSDLLYDEAEAKRYEGSLYVTLYLSPKDYHLIHAPASGVVAEAS